MKLLWANDIHLEWLSQKALELFLQELCKENVDCVAISGDIAVASIISQCLKILEEALQKNIFFALGNHDYYGSSIQEVTSTVSKICQNSLYLHWVSEPKIFPLTSKTVLIGHDGWGDARLGNFLNTPVEMTDFVVIQDFKGMNKKEITAKLNQLGNEVAKHIDDVLPQALNQGEHIVFVTHVPPFWEGTWYDGKHSSEDFLPYMCCAAAGNALKQWMQQYPNKRMTVLCGHTHGGGVSQILPNLVCYTGEALYSHPRISQIFEWD